MVHSQVSRLAPTMLRNSWYLIQVNVLFDESAPLTVYVSSFNGTAQAMELHRIDFLSGVLQHRDWECNQLRRRDIIAS
jgi:hypothetical protein